MSCCARQVLAQGPCNVQETFASSSISGAALVTGLTGNHYGCNALDVISEDRELAPVLGHHARHVFVEHVLLQCGDKRNLDQQRQGQSGCLGKCVW